MKRLLLLSLIAVATFSSAHNHEKDFIESKTLNLPVKGISSFTIKAGAGSLELIGDDTQQISVVADIYQKNTSQPYCLSLDENNNEALLSANTCHDDNETQINLKVTLPRELVSTIYDSSGSIKAENTSISVIEDTSGSISVMNNGVSLRIEDGSGKIDIENVTGDLAIIDGSGAIIVNQVTGDVTVNDGSGSISVDNARSFKLIDDGSGQVRLNNVKSQH